MAGTLSQMARPADAGPAGIWSTGSTRTRLRPGRIRLRSPRGRRRVRRIAAPRHWQRIAIRHRGRRHGAGTLRTLIQIVTPLIGPGLGASAVITFLFTWNDLLLALTLTSSKDAETLPVGLTNFVTQYGIDWGPMSAAGVLMVIPTLIFVWFAQGLLVKGLISGAVRG